MSKVRHCPVCGVKVAGAAWEIWCSNRCRAARHQPRDAAAKAPGLAPPAPVAVLVAKPEKKTVAGKSVASTPAATPVGTSPAGASTKAVEPSRPACARDGCADLAAPRVSAKGPAPRYCAEHKPGARRQKPAAAPPDPPPSTLAAAGPRCGARARGAHGPGPRRGGVGRGRAGQRRS